MCRLERSGTHGCRVESRPNTCDVGGGGESTSDSSGRWRSWRGLQAKKSHEMQTVR